MVDFLGSIHCSNSRMQCLGFLFFNVLICAHSLFYTDRKWGFDQGNKIGTKVWSSLRFQPQSLGDKSFLCHIYTLRITGVSFASLLLMWDLGRPWLHVWNGVCENMIPMQYQRPCSIWISIYIQEQLTLCFCHLLMWWLLVTRHRFHINEWFTLHKLFEHRA